VGSAVAPDVVGSLCLGWVSTGLVGSGVVGVPDSVVLVCAPPLLLTVTPEPTWVLEDVVPDGLVVPVAVVPVDVDPLAGAEPLPVVVEVGVPVVDVVADPVVDSPVEVEVAELDDDDSEDAPVVSAAASP